jgi:hypothetical protein
LFCLADLQLLGALAAGKRSRAPDRARVVVTDLTATMTLHR